MEKPDGMPDGIWQQLMQVEWARQHAMREEARRHEMMKAASAIAQQNARHPQKARHDDRVSVTDYLARIRAGCD